MKMPEKIYRKLFWWGVVVKALLAAGEVVLGGLLTFTTAFLGFVIAGGGLTELGLKGLGVTVVGLVILVSMVWLGAISIEWMTQQESRFAEARADLKRQIKSAFATSAKWARS